MRIKILFVVLFLSQAIFGQQFNAINITAVQGLPSSEVYKILQDKKGYLWFATDRGVARYNGKTFTNYTTTDGLADNTIFRMFEDRTGRIWFASQSNELCYWEHDSIFKTPASKTINSKLAGEVITDLYLDSAMNIWIETNSSVYFCEAGKKYRLLEKIKTDNNYITLKKIENKTVFLGVQRLKPSFIYSGASYTVTCCFDANNCPTNHYKFVGKTKDLSIPGQYVRKKMAKDGTIYFSLFSTLFIIPKNGKTQIKYFDAEIIDIDVDDQRGLWIGFLKKGVAYFKDSNLENDPVNLLDHLSVSGVSTDHEGGIWIATLEKGVFYIPSLFISAYPDVPFLKENITFIGKIKEKLIVNTFGNQLIEITRQQVKTFNELDELKKICQYPITSVRCIRDTVYVNVGWGVLLYTPVFKPILINTYYKKPYWQPDTLENLVPQGVKDLFETDDGRLWGTERVD